MSEIYLFIVDSDVTVMILISRVSAIFVVKVLRLVSFYEKYPHACVLIGTHFLSVKYSTPGHKKRANVLVGTHFLSVKYVIGRVIYVFKFWSAPISYL